MIENYYELILSIYLNYLSKLIIGFKKFYIALYLRYSKIVQPLRRQLCVHIDNFRCQCRVYSPTTIISRVSKVSYYNEDVGSTECACPTTTQPNKYQNNEKVLQVKFLYIMFPKHILFKLVIHWALAHYFKCFLFSRQRS